MAKSVLDKDLDKVVQIEAATRDLSRSLAIPGLLAIFLIGVIALSSVYAHGLFTWFVIVASVIAAYMALNIGANDVANNMGPAVGSRALSMTGALAIAAVAEAAGAILAGGDVVDTISRDLLKGEVTGEPVAFTLVMMAALLAAAMWIHLATLLGAPVSTTHAVVGGVVGAGAAAFGADMVSWNIIGVIVLSWVISPVIGGAIAAAMLGFIKWAIIYRDDKIGAAIRWVPVIVALMAGVFTVYLIDKGVRHIWDAPAIAVAASGVAATAFFWVVVRRWVLRRAPHMQNRRRHIAALFTYPLVVAAALLSFAHGANDVANAVGPLAAIVAVSDTGAVTMGSVSLPVWVLVIGAVGISLGLALFGPRLIRTVGEKITRMDAIRAFCVAASAALTVLVASALGMPVSSTHIAVGAIFGVGFLREYLNNAAIPNPAINPRTRYLRTGHLNRTPEQALKNDLKRRKRRLVRRQHAVGIGAAWIVTVPASALLAAAIYFCAALLYG